VRQQDVETVHAWLLRIERRANVEEVVATLCLPRWRVLLALRSRPDLFLELAGQSWQARK